MIWMDTNIEQIESVSGSSLSLRRKVDMNLWGKNKPGKELQILIIFVLKSTPLFGGTATIQYGDDVVLDCCVAKWWGDTGGSYSYTDNPWCKVVCMSSYNGLYRLQRYLYKFPIPEYLYNLQIDSAFIDLYAESYYNTDSSGFSLTVTDLMTAGLTEAFEAQNSVAPWLQVGGFDYDTSSVYPFGYSGWVKLDISILVSKWLQFQRENLGLAVRMFPEEFPTSNGVKLAQSTNSADIWPKILIHSSAISDTLFTSDATSINSFSDTETPAGFKIYPNPSNSSFRIKYHIPSQTDVTIRVYRVTGQSVKSWHLTDQSKGTYLFSWDGYDDAKMDVGSGIYILSIQSGLVSQSIKLVRIN